MAQTGKRDKYMYPLPKYEALSHASDSSSLKIIQDATNFLVVPGKEELSTVNVVVIAKSFTAQVINSQGISAGDIATPLYYEDDYGPDDFNDSIIIRGRTRTSEATIIELDPTEISEVKTSANYRRKIFSLPGVETGAIIQYEYEITYRFDVQYSNIFELMSSFPTQLSRYYIILPLKWEASFGAFPSSIVLDPPTRVQTGIFGTQPAFVWEAADMSELESEDYMPLSSAVVPRLYFGVTSANIMGFNYRDNWNDYGHKIIGDRIKSKMKDDLQIKSMVEKLVSSQAGWKATAEAIYYYIQKEFQVSTLAYLPGQTASETFKEKEGNSADLGVLFIKMLKQANINSFPALIRNRHHGDFPRKVPMADWFDKMIAMVVDNKDTLWVDPSSRTSKSGTLPLEDQGVDALVIAGNDTKFITTPVAAKEINHQSKTYFSRIAEDGMLHASCLINNSGEYDRLERDEYKDLYEKEIREKIRTQIISYYPSAVLKNYTVSDIKDYTTNFTVNFDFQVLKFFAKTDTSNFFYFEPFLLTESRLLPSLPVRPRKYPIKFAFEDRITTTVTWEIPASFEIVSLPQSMTIKKSFADYIAKFAAANNKITAERILRLNTDTIYNKDFNAFREFSKSVRANGNSKIILRRKK